MARAWVSLALGAPERAELERRVAELRERYGDVALHRPRGLQHRLFADHLPRPDGGEVSDYRQQMTVEQLAAMVPIASAEVGSPGGTYVGYSPSGGGRPVRYDPTEAPRTARPSAVLLAGTLGSGKTLAAQAIAFGAERRGSLVVDFDPKPDHGLDRIPELEGRVEVLELSGDERQRGRLDPLRIGLPELREELAASYLLGAAARPAALLGGGDRPRSARRGARWRAEPALRGRAAARRRGRRRAGGRRGARGALGLRLRPARLRAGGGGVMEAERSVVTIRTPGLTLPDPGASRETYTRAERVSVATLSLVAALALRMVSGDRSRHKVLILDEAWFLLGSVQGRSLLNRVIRLGRAFNATVLVATQRLADLGELSELFGTYFLFGQETEREARAGLEQIGRDPETEGRTRGMTEYRRGLCLMRDLDGRVGELQFDLVFPELLEALDSTPREAGR